MRTDPVELVDQGARSPARPRVLGAVRALLSPATVEPVDLVGFRHISEREPGPWICCSPTSGAMVGHYAVGSPATLAEAHAIRAAAGLPHAGGMTPAELRAGVLARLDLRLALVTTDRDAIAGRLAGGWALAAPLTYGKLPANLRRWSPAFGGGHSVAIAGVRDGRWGWFDPLAPAGWGGEYVDPASVMPALWSAGIMGAERAAGRRSDVAILIRPAVVDGRAGVPFYDAPGGAQVGKLSRDQVVVVVGVPMDASTDHLDLRWRAVQLTTQAIDGTPADKVMYVLASTVSIERPQPAPPAGGCTPAQLDAAHLAGAQAEYDRVHARPR